MKSIIVLTLSLLFAQSAIAQHTISDTFKDENDAPVEYLQVAAFVDDSLVSGAVTDENGTFSLALSEGTYTVAADLFGTSVYKDTLAVNEPIDLGIIPVNTQVVTNCHELRFVLFQFLPIDLGIFNSHLK